MSASRADDGQRRAVGVGKRHGSSSRSADTSTSWPRGRAWIDLGGTRTLSIMLWWTMNFGRPSSPTIGHPRAAVLLHLGDQVDEQDLVTRRRHQVLVEHLARLDHPLDDRDLVAATSARSRRARVTAPVAGTVRTPATYGDQRPCPARPTAAPNGSIGNRPSTVRRICSRPGRRTTRRGPARAGSPACKSPTDSTHGTRDADTNSASAPCYIDDAATRLGDRCERRRPRRLTAARSTASPVELDHR